MLKVYEYSHLGGLEILQKRFPQIDAEVDKIIKAVKLTEKTKVSKEKTMKGKLLYDPALLNRLFTDEFNRRGWKKLRSTFTIELDKGSLQRD